jgi:hypothetical protein
MTAHRPESSSDEAALSVPLSPVYPGEWPRVGVVFAAVFERLKGVLLVIRDELNDERQKS